MTIQPDTVLKRDDVFHGNLFDLYVDTVELPNGKQAKREIVEHKQTVAVLPLLDDGRIVMVQQYRTAAGKVLLEVVAGGIDSGEEPEHAASRELQEETGYKAGRARHLTSFYTSPGYTTEFMHLFEMTGLQPGQQTEPSDEIEVVRLPFEDALGRVLSGEVQDAKTILAILWYAHGQQ